LAFRPPYRDNRYVFVLTPGLGGFATSWADFPLISRAGSKKSSPFRVDGFHNSVGPGAPRAGFGCGLLGEGRRKRRPVLPFQGR
jgi:hypothetical protein